MNSQLQYAETPAEKSLPDNLDLGRFVEQLSREYARQTSPVLSGVDLRTATRNPFPEPIRLTPVDQGGQAMGNSITTIGRDLSNTGIGFFHTDPITVRHVLIEFNGMADQGLLTRLVWCRFRKDGWYVSGGHFVKVLDVPGEE